MTAPAAPAAESLVELEIKLAYQEHLISELETLARAFGTRLDSVERELRELKQTVRSPDGALGPANEPPPHY